MNQISTITEDYTRQDQRLKFEMTVTKKFETVTKNATCGDLVVMNKVQSQTFFSKTKVQTQYGAFINSVT